MEGRVSAFSLKLLEVNPKILYMKALIKSR